MRVRLLTSSRRARACPLVHSDGLVFILDYLDFLVAGALTGAVKG